jgi:hypothetical protein
LEIFDVFLSQKTLKTTKFLEINLEKMPCPRDVEGFPPMFGVKKIQT